MDIWRTAIATSDDTHIWIRGYNVTALMTRAGFTETIFLLHQGRLPEVGERRLLDAILVGVADHGAGAPSCATARLAASGNRQSFSAAIAAGILAIGDEHGVAQYQLAVVDQQRNRAIGGDHQIDIAVQKFVARPDARGPSDLGESDRPLLGERDGARYELPVNRKSRRTLASRLRQSGGLSR